MQEDSQAAFVARTAHPLKRAIRVKEEKKGNSKAEHIMSMVTPWLVSGQGNKKED
jgi:hypothetical protein